MKLRGPFLRVVENAGGGGGGRGGRCKDIMDSKGWKK